MSWLLFAYSAGVFIATFPVAFFFHRYPWRRGPLVVAVIVMELSFVLFMCANPYWSMVLSRVIQGACSCVVWTVGFALLCENIEPSRLGRSMGFAFSGLSIGATIAPPIGGALYKHLGWHAPFIFVIIVCGADLIARLFILEKRDIAKYNKKHNAHLSAVATSEAASRAASGANTPVPGAANLASHEAIEAAVNGAALTHTDSMAPTAVSSSLVGLDEYAKTDGVKGPTPGKELAPTVTTTTDDREEPVKELSAVQVFVQLASLPRGTVAFFLVFSFGFLLGALDATLTIRVESVWHKDSDFVGLIYLAGAAPSFFVGPIAGHIADKFGTEWVVLPTVLFCIPWLPALTSTASLAGFIVFFALLTMAGTMLNSVASLEMAKVSHFTPGISAIHEFAAMNLAFATSSAIGAIVGGQIYNSVSNGWAVVCWICFGVTFAAAIPAAVWCGSNPLLWRALRRPQPLSVVPPEDRPAAIERREAYKAAKAARRGGAAADVVAVEVV